MEYHGVITFVRYYSESSKYIVALVDVEEEERKIWMTGYMSYVSKQDRYLFNGDYVVHPKYGKQFSIKSYEVIHASQQEEVIKYLSSSLFKGIGIKQATLIVEALGDEALNLIKGDKHVLDGIKGMSEAKRDLIYATLSTQDYDHKVLNFFMQYGLNTRFISQIQAKYKEHTIEMIQDNPYRLMIDIDGIGFKSADDMAMKLGFDEYDERRLKAAVHYSLQEACFKSGSIYQYYDSISHLFHKMVVNVDESYVLKYLDELIEDKSIVYENERFYPDNLYQSEMTIMRGVKRWLSFSHVDYEDLDERIERIEAKLGLNYDDTQKDAIKSFLRYPFMIITGGPGTGKTTIVKAMIEIYHSLYTEDKIALVAPTGRAAKRLGELSEIEACTIHRLLKWDMDTNTFAHDEANPLDYDLIIIDEFSMVDSLLFANLIKASSKITKVLLVGDDQQLPSVSPGTVLKDLLEIDEIPKMRLSHIYRQSEDSGIIQLAHQLRNDDYNVEIFNEYDDISFNFSTSIDMIGQVEMLVNELMNEGYDEEDIQVLAPMYNGVAGIDAFNEALQEMFNPKDRYKVELKIGKKIYREGDKVLNLKNRVDDNVFNGDIGRIIEINKKDSYNPEDTIVVDYDGNLVEYNTNQFNTLTHAYCVSIHKSQGNEFKIVIMSVLNDYYIMLRKNLLYTGITRAKKNLYILGNHDAFMRGVKNNKDEHRLTSLSERFHRKMSIYDFEE